MLRPPTPLILALVLAATAAPRAARADDWLALLPDCGFGSATPGPQALIYPRVGLPAVVAVGQDLVARLQAPLALTPPPGIQQERVLRPWGVELIGTGVAVDGPVEHRYRLRVIDVRPDGHGTIVYRVRVPIPRYVPPGTYALSLRSPWAQGAVAVGAVRVVEADAEVRLGVLGPRDEEGDPVVAWRRALAAAVHAPVDVWLARDEPALRAALRGLVGTPRPAVLLVGESGPPVVLRTRAAALEFGRCAPRYVPFDVQRDAAIGALPRRLVGRDEWPESGTVRLPDGTTAPLVAGSLRVEGTHDSRTLSLPAVPGGMAELTILVPEDGRATRFQGASNVSWAPAVDLVPGGLLPTLAARVRVPGTDLVVERHEGQGLGLELAASSSAVSLDEAVRFDAEVARAARVFWVLDEFVTTEGASVEHSFGVLGRLEAHALAIADDGVVARGGTRVRVSTHQPLGCSASSGPSSPAAFWLLFGFAWTMAHRRRKMRPFLVGPE